MNIGEIEKSVDYEMVKVKIRAKQFISTQSALSWWQNRKRGSSVYS